MPRRRNVRPPLLCRWLVRVASWIVPPLARPEWRVKWDSNLWNWWILFERGELTFRDQAELLRYSWASLLDALWIRAGREHLRHTLRSPGFLLAAATVVLVGIGIGSRGFTATRALLKPVPWDDSASLVSIRYTGAAGEPYGVPARLVPLWRKKSALLSGLAGFRHPAYAPRAWATPDFFPLLGTRAAYGRTFRPGDGDVAVLSAGTWRALFGADPKAVGRTVPLDSRPYRIIGILPDGFWAVSPAIEVWTPLTLEPEPTPDVPFLIGALGRLKPGVSDAKLRRELLEIAQNANQPLPRAPQVIEFTGLPERLFRVYLFGIAFALLVGLVLGFRVRPPVARPGWRYSSFFSLKTLFAVIIPPLLWIELGAAVLARLPEGGLAIFGVVFNLASMLGCALALWWSFADQRRRCPVCLQRLTMPVSMGSWGSVFDPATTEFLCEAGHGSLCVSETQSDEPERWTALDPSWRELFSAK